MNRLNKHVEKMIIPGNTQKTERRQTTEYKTIKQQIYRLKAKDEGHPDLPALRRKLRETTASDQFDPEYRRLRYIRYADDFLLGFAGPRDEAEKIKDQLRVFLTEQLKLELSPEKTPILFSAHPGLIIFEFLFISVDGSLRPAIRLPAGGRLAHRLGAAAGSPLA